MLIYQRVAKLGPKYTMFRYFSMVCDTYQWENDGFLQETGEPWKILYMKDGGWMGFWVGA